MPEHVHPLVGSFTERGVTKTIGTSATDQQYINCYFEQAVNAPLGSKYLSVVKRPGFSSSTPVSGKLIKVLDHLSSDFAQVYSVLDGSTYHIYAGGTDMGAMSTNDVIRQVAGGLINQVSCLVFLESGSPYTGWVLFKDASTTNFPSFTGDTHTNTTIDGIASTTGLYAGQLITGTGIQAGTRIQSVDSSSAITTTLATTATNSGVTITKEALAKIIDSDWPTAQIPNSIAMMDGFLLIGTQYGRIYNTALNNPLSIAADDYISADYESDWLSPIVKIGNTIAAIGSAASANGSTWQSFFHDGNNASGSILSRINGSEFFGPGITGGCAQSSGAMYFVNTKANSSGPVGLYRVSARSLPELLTDNITGSIISGTSSSVVTAVNIGLRKFIAMYGGGTGALLYDPTLNVCTEIQTATAINGMFAGWFTYGDTNGKLYSWRTSDLYQDDGSAFTMTIQTEPIVLNKGRPFHINRIILLGDNQASGSTTINTYGNDYSGSATYTGTLDMTKTRKEVLKCGRYESHVIVKLEHSANTPWRAQAVVIEWEPA